MARFVFEATADRLSPSAVEHYQHQQPKSSIHRSFASLVFATMLWTIGMVFTNFVDLSSAGIKRFVFAAGSLPCGVLAWNASQVSHVRVLYSPKAPEFIELRSDGSILCPAQIRYERIGALLAPREIPQSSLLLSRCCFRRELCRGAHRRCYDKSQDPSPTHDSSL